MKTQVTSTSIAAYRAHTDKQKQAEQFARLVLKRTQSGQRSWDKQVFRDTGIYPNTVSARRNEIELAGIVLDGVNYKITDSGRAKDPITKRTVNTYQLTPAGDSPQMLLFP